VDSGECGGGTGFNDTTVGVGGSLGFGAAAFLTRFGGATGVGSARLATVGTDGSGFVALWTIVFGIFFYRFDPPAIFCWTKRARKVTQVGCRVKWPRTGRPDFESAGQYGGTYDLRAARGSLPMG
jgi:hypothetical protein